MEVKAIDHVNLHVPDGGVDAAVEFYGDVLGFAVENMAAYRAGEKPFFSFRVTPDSVLHVYPDEAFEEPDGSNYDHLALRVDRSIDGVTSALDDAGVEVERKLDAPLGATGTAPAVYVRDPFGYRVELKASASRS